MIRIASLLLMLPSLALAEPYQGEAPGRSERYTYEATIIRVIDGDTVVADIDLGFHVWRRDERLRLARIDAPEGKAGIRAGAWLRQRVEGKTIIIRTVKDKRGKYGRYLVELFDSGGSINDQLVAEGLAAYWGKK